MTTTPQQDEPLPFTCLRCGDGNTGLYCLNCADVLLRARVASLESDVKTLREALEATIPVLRGRPECSYELDKAANALMDLGINKVCNGWLIEDLAATSPERSKET